MMGIRMCLGYMLNIDFKKNVQCNLGLEGVEPHERGPLSLLGSIPVNTSIVIRTPLMAVLTRPPEIENGFLSTVRLAF